MLISRERNEKSKALSDKEIALANESAALVKETAAREKATSEEARANERAEEATKQQKIAEEQELLARRRFYAAQMNLAMQAWADGEPARVLDLLESQRPRFDDVDVRGFEWYHLWHLCHRGCRSFLPVSGSVQHAAFAPDGRTIAICFADRNVTLWDAESGQSRLLLESPTYISRLAFSPDGQTMAIAVGSRIKLMNWLKREEKGELARGPSAISIVFSPDGKKLLSGYADDVVACWDVASQKLDGSFTAKSHRTMDYNGVRHVAISPDGKTLALGSGWILIVGTWDGTQFTELRRHEDLRHNVNSVTFSPDGKSLAVSTLDSGRDTSQLERPKLDRPTDSPLLEESSQEPPREVNRPSAPPSTVVTTKPGVRIFDVETGKDRVVLKGRGPTGFLSQAIFSPDGATLAIASDRSVYSFDLESGEPKAAAHVTPTHRGAVMCLAFSHDGKWLATAGRDDVVKLWDRQAEAEVAVITRPGASNISFNPEGALVAGGGTVWLWDTQNGREIATRRFDGSMFAPLSADGKTLVTRSPTPGVFRVWDFSSSKELFRVPTYQAGVMAAAISPDGKTLAIAAEERDIKLWDIPGKRLNAVLTNPDQSFKIAWSPDGRFVATGGWHGRVRLFDVGTQRQVGDFSSGIRWVMALAFTSDSSLLAAGSRDGNIKVFDIAKLRLLATLRGHADAVSAVAFFPDGQTVASGSEEGPVKLWDLATGQERITLKGHRAQVRGLAVSKDGSLLATNSADGTTRLYRSTQHPQALAVRSELTPEDAASPLRHIETAQQLWAADHLDSAAAEYDEARRRLEKLATAFPQNHDYRRELARTRLSLALLNAAERDAGGSHVSAGELAATRYLDSLPAGQIQTLANEFIALGNALRASRRPGDAQRCFTAAIEFTPHSGAAWFARAYDHGQVGEREQALADYAKVVELEPSNAGAWNNMGVIHGNRGHLEKAIECYSKAIALNATEELYWHNRGQNYRDSGQHEKALADFTRAVELAPKNLTYRLDRARALTQFRLWEEAAAECTRIIELDATNPTAWRYRGMTWFDAGKFEAAAKDLSKTLEMDPKDVEVWYLLGRARSELGRQDEMIAGYAAAFAKEPGTAEDWHHRAQFFSRLGLWLEAAADFAKAFPVLQSVRIQDCYLHAVARYFAGDEPGYRQICDLAHKRFGSTQDPVTAYFLAQTCQLAPKPSIPAAQVVALAEKAVADERSIARLNCLGMAYYRAGQYDRAEQAFQDCVKLDANWEPAWVQAFLAMSQHRRGQTDAARQSLEQATRALDQTTELMFENHVGYGNQDWWDVLQTQLHHAEAWKLIHGAASAEDARLWVVRGRALEAIGRGEEAKASFAKAAELKRDDLLIFLRSQPPVKTAGNMESFLAEARNFLAAHPNQSSEARQALARQHLDLASHLQQRQRVEQAQAVFAMALEISQDHPNIRFKRGNIYASLGLRNEALADYSQLIESATEGLNLRAIHTQRAAIHMQQGEFTLALADYESAWKQAPEHADANNNLAWHLATCPDEKLWDPRRAVALARKAVELAPKNWMYHNTLGVACYRAGQWQDAILSLEKSIELSQSRAAFDLLFLAMAHWRLDRRDEAKMLYGQALGWMEQNPQPNAEIDRFLDEASQVTGLSPPVPDPARLVALAVASVDADDWSKARAYFAKAIQADPKRAETWIARGRALAQLGHARSADADFAEAAALTPNELHKFLEAGWWVAGPYPADLATACPPEQSPDPSQPLAAMPGQPGRVSALSTGQVWRRVEGNAMGTIQLGTLFSDASNLSCYC